MVAQRNPQIGKAAVKLRELSADERARDMLERRLKRQRDLAMWEDHAREQGEKKAAFEIARNMIANGETIEKIMMYTSLTREEAEGL